MTTTNATTKIITITDAGYGWVEYRLCGSVLEMTEDNGCTDALVKNGCKINSEMTDSEIESAVWDSWTDGYDGDPTENGLTVEVRDKKASRHD